MNAHRIRLESSLTVLLAALILLQLVNALYHAWPFTTDDAFISWHYAQTMANGLGFRWYANTPPVEGYSNFLWVLLASLFIKLGVPLIPAIKCFASVSLLAAFVFLYQFARTFLSPLLAMLPVYLFSHYQGVSWWTVSGFETSFFVALALLMSWQTASALGFSQWQDSAIPFKKNRYHARAWLIGCLNLTLLALTRFEGLLWIIAPIAFLLCCHSHYKLSSSQLRGMFIIFALGFILPYSIYFSWRLIYFGHLLPNSYRCKAIVSTHSFHLVIDYLYLLFPCLILSLPYLLARKDCRHLLLWLPSLLYCLLLCRADPVIAYYNRLFLAAFSVFSLLPVLGVKEFLTNFHFSAKNNTLASLLIIVLFTHLFIPTGKIVDIDTEVKHYQQRSAIRMKVVEFLNRYATPNAKILLADCGIIPFFARKDLQFIDSQCLTNAEMTSTRIHLSLPLYAQDLQQKIKPDWVIRTYYPQWQRGNDLTEVLQQHDFFKNYHLIVTYQSHRFDSLQGKPQEGEADFIYKIYARNELANYLMQKIDH
ncbi:protein LphB [Legionella donaldsonii]|uniref:Protein LphB n=1 Tax=Legionella donaldsonii TaxID=45060 RepID=A0A378J0I7_9GAMM|nr:protein LphB [Legionella donaldsonii]STX41254.1 protein LphB [Legionella donaldsonii]